jgi:hypothetical protein
MSINITPAGAGFFRVGSLIEDAAKKDKVFAVKRSRSYQVNSGSKVKPVNPLLAVSPIVV